jgi:hypothetical protein
MLGPKFHTRSGLAGIDPTNNKPAGDEHISVGVASPEDASPPPVSDDRPMLFESMTSARWWR